MTCAELTPLGLLLAVLAGTFSFPAMILFFVWVAVRWLDSK